MARLCVFVLVCIIASFPNPSLASSADGKYSECGLYLASNPRDKSLCIEISLIEFLVVSVVDWKT